MKRHREDVLSEGSVRLWHAWRDKTGMPYIPSYWSKGTISTMYKGVLAECNDIHSLIHEIAHQKLFTLCKDVLSEQDFPFAHDLIGNPHTRPYLSRSTNISALRVSQKKSSGFLIPTKTWKMSGYPDEESVAHIVRIFQIFQYMSTTPASLSEVVLRSTLPDKIRISRPSIALRNDILKNNVGGRIDTVSEAEMFRKTYKYDKNKAYLSFAWNVPTPFSAPFTRIAPSLDDACSYPCGYWLVQLTCRSTAIAPIQVDGRNPREGEMIEKWAWTRELTNCLDEGFTLHRIVRGWGWTEMSDWMRGWQDLLWQKHEEAADEHAIVQDIIKTMMVGMIGRFLRQPMYHALIPLSESTNEDIPLLMHFDQPGDRIVSDYAMRAVYDPDSTGLCYIASYIMMQMRQELYQIMKREMELGNRIIRTYIDSLETIWPLRQQELLGKGLGQYKEIPYRIKTFEENRSVGLRQEGDGTETLEIKAPGLKEGGERRGQFVRKWEIEGEKY